MHLSQILDPTFCLEEGVFLLARAGIEIEIQLESAPSKQWELIVHFPKGKSSTEGLQDRKSANTLL